jgi:hypothetical protein
MEDIWFGLNFRPEGGLTKERPNYKQFNFLFFEYTTSLPLPWEGHPLGLGTVT